MLKRKIDNFLIEWKKKAERKYVFNKEKYLKPLYASIRNQTLKDIEIIFIDDKSVDSSRDIIKRVILGSVNVIGCPF